MSEVLQFSNNRTDCLADDLLTGAEAMAEFMGVKPRRVYHLLDRHLIPAFQEGGIWRMRKSAYLAHVERLEGAALQRCPNHK